jgi:hypothetical protein
LKVSDNSYFSPVNHSFELAIRNPIYNIFSLMPTQISNPRSLPS